MLSFKKTAASIALIDSAVFSWFFYFSIQTNLLFYQLPHLSGIIDIIFTNDIKSFFTIRLNIVYPKSFSYSGYISDSTPWNRIRMPSNSPLFYCQRSIRKACIVSDSNNKAEASTPMSKRLHNSHPYKQEKLLFLKEEHTAAKVHTWFLQRFWKLFPLIQITVFTMRHYISYKKKWSQIKFKNNTKGEKNKNPPQ